MKRIFGSAESDFNGEIYQKLLKFMLSHNGLIAREM